MSREQRQRVIERGNLHVCRRDSFLDIFASQAAAYRSVNALCEKGLLQLVGSVVLGDSGRPTNFYYNAGKVPYQLLPHEGEVTDICLKYPEAEFVRGRFVNQTIRADWEMLLNGHKFYGERDRGEQTMRQIRQRQMAYSNVRDYLLYVTTSERRLESLRENSEAVREIALFTTFEQVMNDPRGEIVIDVFGERASLYRVVGG